MCHLSEGWRRLRRRSGRSWGRHTTAVARLTGERARRSCLCDDCHSANVDDLNREIVTERNVGPRDAATGQPATTSRARPARRSSTWSRLHPQASVDVWHPVLFEGYLTAAVEGRDGVHRPVGFQVGLYLSNFWRLDRVTRWGRRARCTSWYGTGRENRMQGRLMMSRALMYAPGCHVLRAVTTRMAHRTMRTWSELRAPARLTSHGFGVTERTVQCEDPTAVPSRRAGSAGSELRQSVACPNIAVMLGYVKTSCHTLSTRRQWP